MDYQLQVRDKRERPRANAQVGRVAGQAAKFLRRQLGEIDVRWPDADVFAEETIDALLDRIRKELRP